MVAIAAASWRLAAVQARIGERRAPAAPAVEPPRHSRRPGPEARLGWHRRDPGSPPSDVAGLHRCGASPRTARFGARAVFAVSGDRPGGLAVRAPPVPRRRPRSPLSRADAAARDDLHAVALDHEALVTALKVLSTVGIGTVFFPLFAARPSGCVPTTAAPRALRRGHRGRQRAAQRAGETDRAPCATRRGRPGRARRRHELPERSRTLGGSSPPCCCSCSCRCFAARWRGRGRGCRGDGAGHRLRPGCARRALRLRRALGLCPRRCMGGRDVPAFNAWRREGAGRRPPRRVEPGHAPRLGVDAPLRRARGVERRRAATAPLRRFLCLPPSGRSGGAHELELLPALALRGQLELGLVDSRAPLQRVGAQRSSSSSPRSSSSSPCSPSSSPCSGPSSSPCSSSPVLVVTVLVVALVMGRACGPLEIAHGVALDLRAHVDLGGQRRHPWPA